MPYNAVLLWLQILPSAGPNNWNQRCHLLKISALSSGEFVGIVADDPDCKIDLKTFHYVILNEQAALKKEQEAYQDIQVIRKLDNTMVQRNYLQIKQDVQDITYSEMERLLYDLGLAHLVVRKG